MGTYVNMEALTTAFPFIDTLRDGLATRNRPPRLLLYRVAQPQSRKFTQWKFTRRRTFKSSLVGVFWFFIFLFERCYVSSAFRSYKTVFGCSNCYLKPNKGTFKLYSRGCFRFRNEFTQNAAVVCVCSHLSLNPAAFLINSLYLQHRR